MQPAGINHYAALGLDSDCSAAQIRAAYRLLAKQHHPDLNPNSATAIRLTQAINAAYEILSDAERRAAYDRELATKSKSAAPRPTGRIQRNISVDVNLRIEEFLRGTTRVVNVKDPANPLESEVYELIIPAGTAPGARFRLPRGGAFSGGFIQIRVKALPSFRFKVRGSDLRCDLKIKPLRASQGGTEMIPGATGTQLRIQIPRGAARGETIRVAGEGLPKPRGGRGDLLVRITYRPEIKITRP